MEDDPFLLVKHQVEDALENASSLFDSWKRIQQTVSSPKNQELLWTADELNSSLEAIEQDLDDLDEAFSVSQANPSKFNLTAADLNSRRSFLTQARNKIQSIRNTMANPPAKQWQHFDNGSSGEASNSRHHNDHMLEDENQQQMVMMQEQDTHLDSMSGTLVNLKEIAGTMNTELEDQAMILDDLGDHVDRSQGRLKRAMNRVTYILKKEEESKSGYCICCLIIVLIILLVLVIVI
ncbi:syntaxin-6 [Lichtheimia corymbifera JMRC:FSU:9682]|uniref:Syntaxin-6 n=1 Tax=Lichtheimia corymbifera JMRC:FSU:9682 TaxID=1263082 RepID=A0A068RPB6_9FUNG|nr:syntaxin-6 [Lichtheimia corymbifera JMRC:FSU:9682]